MSIVSLVIAPTLAQLHGKGTHGASHTERKQTKEINVTIQRTDSSQPATITLESNADQALVDALKKDGLITGESYTIELENGVLKVNGNTVDGEKYKGLMKGDRIRIQVNRK